MTLEEAVEVVLQGAIYLSCPRCDGERFVGPVERLDNHPRSRRDYVFARAVCVTCEGYGSILDPIYAFACGMTGTILPGRPATQQFPSMSRLQAQWEVEWIEDQRILELLDAISTETVPQ